MYVHSPSEKIKECFLYVSFSSTFGNPIFPSPSHYAFSYFGIYIVHRWTLCYQNFITLRFALYIFYSKHRNKQLIKMMLVVFTYGGKRWYNYIKQVIFIFFFFHLKERTRFTSYNFRIYANFIPGIGKIICLFIRKIKQKATKVSDRNSFLFFSSFFWNEQTESHFLISTLVPLMFLDNPVSYTDLLASFNFILVRIR